MKPHPVSTVLTAAARGSFPDPDGSVDVVPPWRDGVAGVVSLTGRAYVATARPEAEVTAWEVDGYGRAVNPRFVVWLAGPDGWHDCLDLLLAAFGTGAGRALVRDSLGLVPAGEPVLAAVAPGNAAAVRTFLAGGFQPVGSVQVAVPG